MILLPFHPITQPPHVQHSNNITTGNIYGALTVFKAQSLHLLAVWPWASHFLREFPVAAVTVTTDLMGQNN